MARRRFGKVRKLPSGRFQASFIAPSGERQNAPNTFRTKTDADRWLVKVEADISKGTWLDEKLSLERFEDYAKAYLRDNADVGKRWEETCLRNLRLHMVDLLNKPLITITPPVVRKWHADALAGSGGKTSIAQSYRFLRAVMNQAKRDQAIAVNPCQIRGAGSDTAQERSVASPAEVAELVDAITPYYRAAVLIAAWCGLRRGEIIGLQVADVDLSANQLSVRRNRVELLESDVAFDKDPKTEAGMRAVAIPPHLRPYLVEHMEKWAGKPWLFVGRDGQRMRGNAIYQAHVRARNKVGVDISFHDLRHTGQTLAASTGATLADLKKRMGHASNAAAARYLHAVDGRDAEVAQELSKIAARGEAIKLPRTIIVKH
ncbi:tyrosine-type recombinase/integrase [Nocardia macrotermitis]|uniref:Putative prophage phiRv2 integrase n=1 Tax=Nocardia macrotermitis TaxID=2585198 RepID=A0A7K0D0T9_9NOCA|nr:site-specific integrase [Nocardia macrotermitis]MQY19330.1 putative prophage phiRv2 integrase [Nocardia macrotermitis]